MPARNTPSLPRSIRTAESAAVLLEAFHAKHEQTYTFRLPDTGVELVTYQLGAELDTPRVDLPEISVDATVDDALIGDQSISVGNGGTPQTARVYERERLPPGTELNGPVLDRGADGNDPGSAGPTGIDRPLRPVADRGGRLNTLRRHRHHARPRHQGLRDAGGIRRFAGDRRRLLRHAPRTVGLWQEHDSADDRRLRRTDVGPRPVRRRRYDRSPAQQAAVQHHLPGSRPVSAYVGRRQHRLRPAGSRRRSGELAPSGFPISSPLSRSRAWSAGGFTSSPAASDSASRSPVPSCSSHRCCCSTSR